MFRTFAAAAILVLAATTAQASASHQASVEVPFGDLDLKRPGDAKILAGRLEAAAKSACLKANDTDVEHGDLTPQELQNCMDAAIDLAMLRVANALEAHVRANLVSARHSVP